MDTPSSLKKALAPFIWMYQHTLESSAVQSYRFSFVEVSSSSSACGERSGNVEQQRAGLPAQHHMESSKLQSIVRRSEGQSCRVLRSQFKVKSSCLTWQENKGLQSRKRKSLSFHRTKNLIDELKNYVSVHSEKCDSNIVTWHFQPF